jgi:hypothetical protein
MEIPQLRGRAIKTTLSHVHPRLSFMTKYRKFLSFCTTLGRPNIFLFFYEFNYLHRNLTTVLFFFRILFV